MLRCRRPKANSTRSVPSPFDEPLPDAGEPSASPNARFLTGAVPHGANGRMRFSNSILGSTVAHIVGFLLTLVVIGNMPVTPPATGPADAKPSAVVWLNAPGPGGRGGNPGDGKPEPPRRVERHGQDATTLSAAMPPKLQEPPKDAAEPGTEVTIPAINTAAGVVDLPGALTGLPSVSPLGSLGGGAGMGTGGRTSGFGTGDYGGTGNDAFGTGSGVTMPTVLTEVKPSYTPGAMRAKVQGAVIVEAIVREDGSVGRVRIVRSLDRTFGLDEEALRAVRNWRFAPGTRQGRNVAVIVEIELTFTLR